MNEYLCYPHEYILKKGLDLESLALKLQTKLGTWMNFP